MFTKPPLSRPMLIIFVPFIVALAMYDAALAAARVELREARRQWKGEWT